ERSEQIKEQVYGRRNETFLGQQFDHVGKRLQKTVRTDAVRPHSELDMRQHLAFDPLQVSERGQKDKRNQTRLDETDDEKIIHLCNTAPRAPSRPNRKDGPCRARSPS